MVSIEAFLLVFTPLFVIVNPLGVVPVFLSLTERFKRNRVKIALKVSLTALLVLLFFAFTGLELFHLLGVTVPAFRIAGGIILLRVALDMVRGETKALQTGNYTEDDISVIPLAIPLLSGPGAITTIVVLTNDFPDENVYVALFAVIALSFLILAGSKWVVKVLRERGVRVMIRLFGIILAAVAIQFMLTGIGQAIRAYQGG